jgi:hypothetical protein
MHRISIGSLSVFGLVLGAFFAGQQVKADDGNSGRPDSGKATPAAAPAAEQTPAANAFQGANPRSAWQGVPPAARRPMAATTQVVPDPVGDPDVIRPSSAPGRMGLGGRRQSVAGTGMLPAERPKAAQPATVDPARTALVASTGDPLTVLISGAGHTRLVYRLNSMPVSEMDRMLRELLHQEGELQSSAGTAAKGLSASRVAIASSPVSNSLVISGPPDAVEEMRSLVERLDQRPGLVLLDVEIGEAPIEAKPGETPNTDAKATSARPSSFRLLERPAKMEITAHARLTTLDNQPAFVQLGQRMPMISGVTRSSMGGSMNSITFQNVGLILGVTPRICPDGTVTMQIDVEQSQLGPENEGTPMSSTGDRVVRSPRTDAATVQTTVDVPDGKTIILGSITRQGKTDKELVTILTPHIIRPDAAGKTR